MYDDGLQSVFETLDGAKAYVADLEAVSVVWHESASGRSWFSDLIEGDDGTTRRWTIGTTVMVSA